MGGSVLKLKLQGPQDAYLTSKPVVNFYIKSYENHRNFSLNREKLYFIEAVDFGKKITLPFPKQGDLLSKVFFNFKLPVLTPTTGSYAGWANSIGHYIIDYIDLEIGTELISRYYGLYMEIWEELTSTTPNENYMIGKYSNLKTLEENAKTESEYMVPLPFWFCKHISAALPIVSLFYHQVRIIIKLKDFSDCILYDGATEPLKVKILDACVLADYIHVDDNLKLELKSKSQRILIEQVQSKNTQGADTNSSNGIFNTDLPFNGMVKELFWVFIEDESAENNDGFNFSKRNTSPNTKVHSLMKNSKFLVEGVEYIEEQGELVYRSLNNHRNKTDRHIYTISFCAHPEIREPSGSLNFSKFDYATLYGEMITPTPLNKMFIFATNHNWISIDKGLSSLMFIA